MSAELLASLSDTVADLHASADAQLRADALAPGPSQLTLAAFKVAEPELPAV